MLCVLLAATASAIAAKPRWTPVPAEELALPAADAASGVPAEVLFHLVDVDDRRYPQERTTTSYVRYKILDPEKSEHILRLSTVEFAGSQDRLEVYARLISPDGRVQEFGREALKERPLVQQAKQAGILGWLVGQPRAATERFLAIPGVERGAVLEYYTSFEDQYPGPIGFTLAQREHLPVRRFEYRARAKDSDGFFNRTFVTNSTEARMVEDPKAKTITVTAVNLAPIVFEPFGGALADQVVSVLNCYEQTQVYLQPRSGRVALPGRIEAKLGPWAAYATLVDWAARDRGYPTKASAKLAADITREAQGDEARAAAIHRWVQQQWQAYRQALREIAGRERTKLAGSLDDVIDWEKKSSILLTPDEFLWLALSLCRSAGLTAHVVLLPNREFSRFNPAIVSPVFLPHQGIAIRVGETWQFSSPHHGFALPFNLLPWQQEGQRGLLAQDRKEDFIDVPLSSAKRSLYATGGTLTLDPDGTLHGNFLRRLTGQLAVALRGELRAAPPADRMDHAKKRLGLDLQAVEVSVTKIDGLDDPEQALEISGTMRWPDFAVQTRDRMIIRPAVFRTEASNPFAAEDRRRPVFFPYRWQELDQLVIALPAGFELESPRSPAPSEGDVLHYRVSLSHEKETRRLHVRREFMSNVASIRTDYYRQLREFYVRVAEGDQHELVLRRNSAAASP